MNHLSFYWLPDNRQALISSLESEFADLVEQSINSGKISLPPIPTVVLRVQQLCMKESSTVSDVADCLADDPSLAAIVIRIANTVVFNRRNITCNDLLTAVSRLGMIRVRDIVTAQSIDQLKHSSNLSPQCNKILANSAHTAKELGATMLLVAETFKALFPKKYAHLEDEKALLVGLLADIGLFCLVNEYHLYLERGNYLDEEIALQIFRSSCSKTSQSVLGGWGFDLDFQEVASNEELQTHQHEVNYLDIARIASHLLMFRKSDNAITEHDVEINADGADVLFELSNLSDYQFNESLRSAISRSGF
ncbi:HDOD domain-containing protein [Vibrio palustris]|uniref:HDOD domain protein n=1 Tax=Vibrio palustris TaxID=1918946 RepID=A0A1R4B1Z0_9VIBR|nr:HDOD domain-containing protein [Vibrio palustris]SJL82936.1 HDOD domain protein [Vibrio palustris]